MATDYARLAKRISATTTNCLLTAIVLVAGLGFGRQVLRWWSSDSSTSAGPSRPTPMADGLGDLSRLHVLHFGQQPWSVCRQSISGGRDTAAATLRAACREMLQQRRLRDEPPGEAEREFLRRLGHREPVEQEPEKWRLYELDGAFPVVVGTQPQATTGAPLPEGDSAARGDRAVVWGLAFPAGSEVWTLLSFQPGEPAVDSADAAPVIPLPEGCKRTLSVRVAGGGATVAFAGPHEPEAWMEFYRQWFAAHNWRAAGQWRQFGPRWHGRYAAPAQDPDRRWEVDVHFSHDAAGHGAGLLIITPSESGSG